MQPSSRYMIGIDLGTTNSVLAYADTEGGSASGDIRIFSVQQVVHPGEVRSFATLPSFLYFPIEAEAELEGLSLPWEEQPPAVTGVMAREHGALAPGRQVASAKSWLCNDAVDRRARILPWGAAQPMVSPVEASARYLAHLRAAWNYAMATAGSDPQKLFENQEVVLTVPASFDEEARELTVEAAQQAGIQHLTLLEEPLAAFYAWIAGHRDSISAELRDGQLVLICDIGGGTSDFSLIRVRVVNGEPQFERTAIGEHLLLGGDNLDVALARRVEEKLKPATLSLAQRQALQRACCFAKERLLSDRALEGVPITVLGGGRAVVGQMRGSELTRGDVLQLLTHGFLPLTSADELPKHERRAGLRELGLPYASDPAITRHLAAFLAQAAAAMSLESRTSHGENGHSRLARPDAILFNGGFCTPAITRERIAESIAGWFGGAESGWRPKILNNAALESAVAVGAAYYGQVRRGAGQRIRAGSARTYYIGTRSEQQLQGVCVLPAGVEEGASLALSNREFAVLANRPASFSLYSSRTRHDRHGEVVTLSEGEVHRHAPLVTLLRYGKKLRDLELAVRLTVNFTELGTLEVWCESLSSPHRWRLQFELRGEESKLRQAESPGEPEVRTEGTQPSVTHPPVVVPEESVESAVGLIYAVFAKTKNAPEAGASGALAHAGVAIAPETLVSKLEAALEHNRDAWPIATARTLGDALLQLMEGRRKTTAHEVRWLNLAGFCLRPGFGAPRDDWRMGQVRKLYLSGPAFPDELQSQVEWSVLWRRVSGGLAAATQQELYRKYTALLGAGRKKSSGRLNSQLERECWRLLASLEHLPAALRVLLGNHLLAKIKKTPTDRNWLWSLGRLGARIPLYGPLGCVVPAETASEWLRFLLELPEFTPDTASAVIQLAYVTGDRTRDLPDDLRQQTLGRLAAAGTAEELIQHLRTYVPAGRTEVARAFGESLPRDLNLASSANCLLPIEGLMSEAQTADKERVG